MNKLHIFIFVVVLFFCLSLYLVCGAIGQTGDGVETQEPVDIEPITELVIPSEETTESPVETEKEPVEIEPITDKVEPEPSETLSDPIETEEQDPVTIHIETEQETPTELPEPLVKLSEMVNQGRDGVGYGEIANSEKLVELENILDSYAPRISVAVYSLDGSKGYIYNGKQEYFSACTIKMPWMLYMCKGIDSGKYDKDTVLTYEEEHWRDGSGKIRYGNYGDTYTLEELITLSLSISDNVAYYMITKYVNRNDFNAFADELGYNSFKINSWSIWSHNSVVRDYLGLWCAAYDYFQEDTVGSNILKNACTNTRFNYGTLTLKKMNNYDYSHKSGENYGDNCTYNDAGLVWSDSPYVYAVFTKSEGTDYDTQIVNSVMTILHGLFA